MLNKKSIKLLIVVFALVTLFGVSQLRAEECDDPLFSITETERIIESSEGDTLKLVYAPCTGEYIATYRWDEDTQTWVKVEETRYTISLGPDGPEEGNERVVIGYFPETGGYIGGSICKTMRGMTCGGR